MLRAAPYTAADTAAICGLWNAAFGPRFPMTPRLWQQNTAGDPSFRPADVIMAEDATGGLAGFALARRYRPDVPPAEGMANYADWGFIAAIAVRPEMHGRGIGRQLFTAGETHLAGVGKIFAGGNLRVFFPGIPDGYPAAAHLFAAAGYAPFGTEYDLAGDIVPEVYEAAIARAAGVAFRQARQGEEAAVLAFLDAIFPGRWPYEVRLYLAQGGDIGDITLAVAADGTIAGFLMSYHSRSAVLGGAYMWVAGRDGWGAIGPLGLRRDARGTGAGLGLVAAGLRHLHTHGAIHARIDWTTLRDFYARLGFSPTETYQRYAKTVRNRTFAWG